MAEEVEMTPVEAAEPPKVNPLAKAGAPAAPVTAIRKPATGVTQSALRPGLKLPPKPGVATGMKLPTQTALKPGLRLPPKPVIRKPGATVAAKPLPKPIAPVGAAPAAPAAAPTAAAKPVAVDAQGIGKLPTVSAKAIARDDAAAPAVSENPKPMEALKSVTQKLKGITQQIPQQAILRKTGIISDAAMSDAQKQAAKSKTARISLSDAMGVAPVKNENAPMKTIRIKRPVDISGTAAGAPKPAPTPAPAAAPAAEAPQAETATSITQRKTLKISRPGGGAVRPTGKFGIKRPATAASAAPEEAAAPAASADGAVADIADIPNIPDMPAPASASDDSPAWLNTLSVIVQVAACVAVAALAWLLYQSSQTMYF